MTPIHLPRVILAPLLREIDPPQTRDPVRHASASAARSTRARRRAGRAPTPRR
jgi:hypothetical protein